MNGGRGPQATSYVIRGRHQARSLAQVLGNRRFTEFVLLLGMPDIYAASSFWFRPFPPLVIYHGTASQVPTRTTLPHLGLSISHPLSFGGD